ncbi:MAG: hypothetical protein NG737_07880 [Omnitrophica bacterium]|nr:hypothetical protein [Candidatus Omnitrophota bacterium]
MAALKVFAKAISYRLADEWDGASEFPEDTILLRKILEKLLTEKPEDCKKLIGTGIIEEDYLEELS